MPTKPSSTIPDWGTAANYVAPGEPWDATARRTSTGLAGAAADGFTPETPAADPTAEQNNEWNGRVAEWFNTWVELGSNTADEDAHIVETDAAGEVKIARGIFGPHSADGDAITATGGGTSGHGVNATGIGIRPGVLATATGTAPGAECVSVSTEPGLLARNAAGGGSGAEGRGNGAGHGLEGLGGTSGSGIEATSGASGGFGGRFIAASTSPAVQGEGNAASASSEGVQGVAQNDGAIGVRGFTTVTATAGVAAVQGDGRGDGDAVHGLADDGYGVVMESDTTAPKRAAGRMVPQDADPTTAQDGDIYVLDHASGFKPLKIRMSTWKYLRHGVFPRIEDGHGSKTTSSSGSALSEYVSAQLQTQFAGDVIASFTCAVSRQIAGDITWDLKSDDVVGGTNDLTHFSGTIECPAGSAYTTVGTNTIAFSGKISPPSNVNRRYYLSLESSGAQRGYHEASIHVTGETN